MPLNYQKVTFAGNATISLFHGGKAYIANSDHPAWQRIVEGCEANDENVVDLFDIAGTVNREFKRLSGRYTVVNGRVHLDGDPMDNSFTKKVLEVLKSGEDNWGPLVKFGENILSNPSEYSRKQLYDFLEHNIFAINEDGLIVGYKGVSIAHGHDKAYHSVRSGATPVSVNDGEAVTGHVYQSVGDSVFMARSLVDDNQGEMCGAGLHVSTYDYATSWGSVVLNVLVHPANVVAVPSERGYHKIRVNAYTVLGISEGQHTEPVVFTGPAPKPVEPEVVVEGNLDTAYEPKVGDKVRLVEGGYWTDGGGYKYTLPTLGFHVDDEAEIVAGDSYSLGDDHIRVSKGPYNAIYLHKSSVELIEPEVQDTPVADNAVKSAADNAGLTEGQDVSLNVYAWYDLSGKPVYDRDYFVTRNIPVGTHGFVHSHQKGALSAKNVLVTFDGDWDVWVAPEALIKR